MRPDRMFEIWSCTRIKERFRLPSSFFLLTVPKQFFCRSSISLAFMVSYVVFLFIYVCLFFVVFFVFLFCFFHCSSSLFLLVPWKAFSSFGALGGCFLF